MITPRDIHYAGATHAALDKLMNQAMDLGRVIMCTAPILEVCGHGQEAERLRGHGMSLWHMRLQLGQLMDHIEREPEAWIPPENEHNGNGDLQAELRAMLESASDLMDGGE